MKILCLGPEGTYSHLAAKKFDNKAEITFVNYILDGFEKMGTGKYDAFLAPAENMIAGSVRETEDALFDYNFIISGSITIPIHHSLLAKSTRITKIYSHIQGINQCRKFIQNKYPKAQIITASSTAKACETAKKEPNSAAIANKVNLDYYPKLKEIHKNIEDYKNNKTKFYVISNNYALTNQKNSAIIVVPRQDSSGLLFKILKAFKKSKINLTKIESRPMRTQIGNYMFYIDFEGDFREKKIAKTLNKLNKSKLIKEIIVLGSY
ncbi:prephenate dehydratase [Patescibacteria group bacterium]|nr:prephenate dehydratase [Patescibacteria group bacterium]